MTSRSVDIRLSERVLPTDAVRPLHSNAARPVGKNAQEFRQKSGERGAGKDKEAPETLDTRSPHDVVEVSNDYITLATGAPPTALPLPTPRPRRTLRNAPTTLSAPAERHLDIKV